MQTNTKPNSILIIQTAFIGDVILATALVEKLKDHFPDCKIDFVLRAGNETLLNENPKIREVLIWTKQNKKKRGLFHLIRQVRSNKYDLVINVQRFFSTGLLTILSGAKMKIGFNKNPLSFLFDKSIPHEIGNTANLLHEVDRNHLLIAWLTDQKVGMPKLYPGVKAIEITIAFKSEPYICIAPASVWFTKQFPEAKWVELINKIDPSFKIFLLGGKEDFELCNRIAQSVNHKNIVNLSSKLNLMESAALIKDAALNICNDSAPLHLASAMSAPVCAIYCSTLPEFGFGPLSSKSYCIQTSESLDCRPCGLHGYNKCPEGHFKCGFTIDTDQIVNLTKAAN